MKRLNNDLIYPQSFPNSLNQLFPLPRMKQNLIFTKQKSSLWSLLFRNAISCLFTHNAMSLPGWKRQPLWIENLR